MKKLLIVLALGLAATGAYAHGPGGRGYHGGAYRGGYYGGWVAPLIIGGALGYAITQPTVIIQQPPVVYQQNPNTGMPYGYHYEQINDANCNCYRTVLVLGQ
jgi:hypothetical protein